MAKLLFISNKDNNFYNFRSEKILELLNRGHEIFLLCPYGKKIDYFTEKGCRFINLDIDRRGTNPIKDLILLRNYIKIINDLNPDIVLTYTTKSSVYGALASRITKKPCIVNNAGLIDPIDYKWYVGFVLKILYKICFAKVNCMIYQNIEERQVLNKILKNKVHFRDIPGSGVNITKYNFTEYPKVEDGVVFNYVARIVRFKGIEEYIQCAEIIKQEFPESEFRIFGDFDDEKYVDIIKSLERRNIVKYMGVKMDMKPFITQSSALIHPSYYEGMSNVVLEHGAMGRPCIGSDIAGVREAIDDGKSGFLFEVKNLGSLVSAVKKFLYLSHEDKSLMGKAARSKIEKEFDRNLVTEIYIEEINQLL